MQSDIKIDTKGKECKVSPIPLYWGRKEKEKENTSGRVFFANTSTTITKTNQKTNLMDLPDADDSRLRKTRSIC